VPDAGREQLLLELEPPPPPLSSRWQQWWQGVREGRRGALLADEHVLGVEHRVADERGGVDVVTAGAIGSSRLDLVHAHPLDGAARDAVGAHFHASRRRCPWCSPMLLYRFTIAIVLASSELAAPVLLS
jgi:hypothetical protein